MVLRVDFAISPGVLLVLISFALLQFAQQHPWSDEAKGDANEDTKADKNRGYESLHIYVRSANGNPERRQLRNKNDVVQPKETNQENGAANYRRHLADIFIVKVFRHHHLPLFTFVFGIQYRRCALHEIPKRRR